MSLSLSKVFMCQKNLGYANKKEKNIHAKKHERKKCMPMSLRKRKLRENKDSPFFQNQYKRESC